ncbi:MAG: hypothetical protein RLY31_2564 [Bacteroidota bacterium]|jgi:hypothetical protein
MKQTLLLLALSCLPFTFLSAQDCEPDALYTDSSAGVYPLPYDADLSPDGGITACAAVGSFFQFNFTIVLGDTLNIGAFAFPMDSIIIQSVEGLPEGLAFACSPGNCHYIKNTLGCAAIYGTPTGNNIPGEYQLTIKGAAFINGSSLPLPLEFPNAALAPGKYTLTLLASDSDPCQYTRTRDTDFFTRLLISPNPAQSTLHLQLDADRAARHDLFLSDALGRPVSWQEIQVQPGGNHFTFPVDDLPDGIYLLSIRHAAGMQTRRVVVRR